MLTKKSTKNNTSLLETLSAFGLEESEAKSYLSLLPLGQTTVLKLSRSSGIKRTSLYHILESLKNKGLIREEFSGFKKYIVAENPKHLPEAIEHKKQRLEKIIPELSSLYKLKEDCSVIKYYEGLASVKNLYNSVLDEIRYGDFYYVISDDAQWLKADQLFFENFIEKRAQKCIQTKLLLAPSPDSIRAQKRMLSQNNIIKLLPDNFEIKTNIAITPKRIIFHQMHDPVHAIVLETKSIIDAHKKLFELLWESH